MGLRDWFLGPQPAPRSSSEIEVLTAPRTEARALMSTASIPTNGEQYGGFAGVHVNDRTAMQHLAVYACVRLLADSIASLPVDVYRKSKGSNVRVPLETPPVLADPDTDINDFEYMQQVVTSLALRGNSIEYITSYDNLERPASRIPIHPDEVQITRNRETGKPEYRINNDPIKDVKRIIHIRRLTLPGQVEGLSPIRQAAQAIGMGLAAERFGARWFADSANPSAILHTDANIDDDEMTRILKSWVSSHGGRRMPAILSGGLDYKPISITPEESQFLQTRDFQRSEIAMFFGIPPHMIGDTTKSTSWGSGIEQLGIGFVKYSLMPWLRCIESTYSRALLPRGQYMRFNVDALLRGDTISRYTAYTQARNAGWLNVDEIREKEDMLPIPDGSGQSFIQPLNMGPLGSDPLAASSGEAQGGDPNAQS